MEIEQEKALVERAASDSSAFGRLYDEHYGRIFGYVLLRTASVADTQDITSEVFLKALLNIKRFKWRGLPFSAWLYRIAGHEIANKYRYDGRRKLLARELEISLSIAGDNEEELAEAERRLSAHADFKAIHAGLSRLPVAYQEVITLRFFEKKSIEEIGRITGKREGTIKSLLHRGLRRLRKLMEQNED